MEIKKQKMQRYLADDTFFSQSILNSFCASQPNQLV